MLFELVVVVSLRSCVVVKQLCSVMPLVAVPSLAAVVTAGPGLISSVGFRVKANQLAAKHQTRIVDLSDGDFHRKEHCDRAQFVIGSNAIGSNVIERNRDR